MFVDSQYENYNSSMNQGGWITKQKVSIKQLSKIKPFLQEVQNDNSPRLMDGLQQIINFFLGTPDNHGILYRLGAQFANYEPLQWASQLQKFLQHIGPQSPTFAQILKRSRDPNAQFIIPNSYLPHYLDPNSISKNRLISVRLTHNGLAVSPLDAFYMMLAYAIYHSQTIMQPMTQYEHLILDDFYSSLSRNPLLVLLRKNIQYFSAKEKHVIQKITYMLRMYLVDEVLVKYDLDRNKNGGGFEDGHRFLNTSTDSILSTSSNRKQLSLKYRLKPHHLHALYLILKFTPQYLSNQFPKYCQALVQNYSSVRPDQYCLQALIRLWIYGMLKPQHNIQNQVIRVLEKANSRQGWFYLKRYSPSSVYVAQSLSMFNMQTAFNLLKLLQKQSNWLANSSYLFTLACLFNFLTNGRVFYYQFANSKKMTMSESRQNAVLQKVFRLIIDRYNRSLVDIFSKIKKKNIQQYKQAHTLIQNYQQIIQQYLTEYFKSKIQSSSLIKSPNRQIQGYLPQQFKFKLIKQSDIRAVDDNSYTIALDAVQKQNVENKRHLVAYYRNNPRSCWQVPIQYNQSTILYYIWYTIAKIVDFAIPGKREQPYINLRFLANPMTLIGVLAILLVLFLVFG